MFELAYETFDGSLSIYISEGTMQELSRELASINYEEFRNDQGLVGKRDNGFFKIAPYEIAGSKEFV